MISGMVAAVAVMAASPAMAWCGYSSCSPCGYSTCGSTYVAPISSYNSYGYGYGCAGGCGWATQRLADPVQQYYYVNQGPTYSGPGNWAPVPTYSEGGSYAVRPYGYGYGYGYRSWRPRVYGYGYRPYRAAYRYGYARGYYGGRHYGYGPRVLRRYY
ncbi:hypothetical protein JQ628_22015 [Bradyrhizobium lablabi]|nr:hypothetical protein [Bradyrhizobium lablabi]